MSILTKILAPAATAAVLFASSIAAHAITVTIKDADGNVSASPASVTLNGATSEFTVEIDVFTSDIGGSFTESVDFVNNTGKDAFLSVATLLSASDFIDPTLVVTGPSVGGAPLSITLDGTDNYVAVLAGTTARFTADFKAKSAGNFDFSVAAVPLPAAGLLLLAGLGGLAATRRRKS